jgi:alkylation response protein AidB-like acyl-CoA dehydrogenase
MDFALTDEQQLLVDTVRNLLANECPTSLLRAHIEDRSAATPLWTHLRAYAELGRGDCTDLCLFLEQLGFVAAPGPYFASVALFAGLLEALDADSSLRDAVAAGEVTGTVAVAGRSGIWSPNDELVKSFIPDADLAQHIAVVSTTGLTGSDIVVTLLPNPGARDLIEITTVDRSRRSFRWDTADEVGGVIPCSPVAWAAFIDRAHVAFAAEMVGTSRRLFGMALDYAKTREQFDRPIGSFQAIQHKLAEMSLLVERAIAAVQYAAMTVDAVHDDRTRACHVAKAAAGTAARRCLKDAIQIHGGIGYTWEHDLHLFLRRATADEYQLGPTTWHHDRIADLLFDSPSSRGVNQQR